MGFAKAFGLVELEDLSLAITKPWGVAWLFAALLVLVTGILFILESPSWWLVGAASVLASQTACIAFWTDARFGTIANLIVMSGVVLGAAAHGPWSLRARYEGRLATMPRAPEVIPRIGEADLSGLPAPVQRYMLAAGVVGTPRVHHFRAEWVGRIRQAEDEDWLEFKAEQVNFINEPTRLFYLEATKMGLPAYIYHEFAVGKASMHGRLLGLVPILDAGGPKMTFAETVTFLNDIAVVAPGALLDERITWEEIDDRSTGVAFTAFGNRVTATLHFGDKNELVDFVSDDRLAISPDGTSYERLRWSTPLSRHDKVGNYTLPTEGKARWHPDSGAWTYVEIELRSLKINE